MTKYSLLDDLFKHTHWADALVWKSVLKIDHEQDTSVVRDLLYHIHVVQHAYLDIWTNQSIELPAVAEFKTLHALSKWGHDYHKKVTKYLAEIDETSLDNFIVFPWEDQVEEKIGKTPQRATLAQMMLQVTSHSTHHRGQVNKLLRQFEQEPPLTDIIAWIWLGKPDPKWSKY